MARRLVSESKQPESIQRIAALQSHFDALALQVRAWAGKRDKVLTLGVMGVAAGVGTSTVACNLAKALAESSFSGQVLSVEAEVTSRSERVKQPGLVEILSLEKKLNDCLTGDCRDSLNRLPFGSLVRGKERETHWAKLSDLVQRELAEFDFVVFDLRPFSQSKVSGRIASQLDGMLLVCKPEGGHDAEINQLRKYLRDFPVEILGKVINRSVEARPAS